MELGGERLREAEDRVLARAVGGLLRIALARDDARDVEDFARP